ncbi:phosphatidylserine/phosphatidylglycerophosphate/cardiolipin synthase family protein [Erythrobacter sp. HKB08]|uniref:phospholipase D-like domain-containing protein n=1 Tax=Erythrobacter sp. HKB08 TaxID=2502843 RepID=UPI00100887C8|nr:phosphatidylserine/phosphatidylglycerophosphate/cardiolipin synthase family protein [Erythrobacter sp. HKB08]
MVGQEISKGRSKTPAWDDPAVFEFDAQGHHLCVLPGGDDRLAAILDLIASARESLRLCFYIYSADRVGTEVRDALVEAARRGVRVQLMVDGFGAEAPDSFFAPLVEAGGTFDRFSPKWSRRYLIRNHQKLIIADGKRAMIGGFNIEDSYFAEKAGEGWQDLGVAIEGAVVEDLTRWFDALSEWAHRPKAQFRAIRKMVREWQPGEGTVRLLIGGPTVGLSSWARHVGHDLIHASRLDMVMAYFSPAYRLLKRIATIGKRGEARLVLAAKSDNGATIGATRSLYSYLLKRDAEIFEFRPRMLHTKLIVIDDKTYIGSANFDMRSLYLNLELMVRIEDSDLAERMRRFIDSHAGASQVITPELHRSRAGVVNRVRWWLSWLLVGVIDYTVSRRLNLGQ